MSSSGDSESQYIMLADRRAKQIITSVLGEAVMRTGSGIPHREPDPKTKPPNSVSACFGTDADPREDPLHDTVSCPCKARYLQLPTATVQPTCLQDWVICLSPAVGVAHKTSQLTKVYHSWCPMHRSSGSIFKTRSGAPAKGRAVWKEIPQADTWHQA